MSLSITRMCVSILIHLFISKCKWMLKIYRQILIVWWCPLLLLLLLLLRSYCECIRGIRGRLFTLNWYWFNAPPLAIWKVIDDYHFRCADVFACTRACISILDFVYVSALQQRPSEMYIFRMALGWRCWCDDKHGYNISVWLLYQLQPHASGFYLHFKMNIKQNEMSELMKITA